MALISSSKAILSFDFTTQNNPGLSDDSESIIHDGLKAVLAVVPLGSNITSLKPTITVSAGATVSPESGEAVDFSAGAVTYTVTAENETTQEYTVNVTGNRLVVPDATYYEGVEGSGGRIVQINDMTGGGWTARDGTDLGLSVDSDFIPYDVDYDIYGRIYIANYHGTSGGILRLNSLDDTSPTTIVSDVGLVPAIAVDRVNSRVYYLADKGSGYQINRCDYDGGSGYTFEYNFYDAYGLAIDEEGMLYVASSPDGGAIDKIDPSGEGSPLLEYWGLNNAWDVLYKSTYIYAADASSPEKVVRLTKDLAYLDELAGKPGGEDDFHGPRRFLAVLNKKFYLIDEDENEPETNNRLVSFDDITGSGWKTYQNGDDPFSFFNYYGGGLY